MESQLDGVQWEPAAPPQRTTSVRQSEWRTRLRAATRSSQPAQRLWAAVLYDAIATLRGHPRTLRVEYRMHMSREHLWREACAWVTSRKHEPLGTFESVCAALELDADSVRRDLCAVAANTGLKLRVPTRRVR